MIFVLDATTSLELIYNEKEGTFTRKIRKNGAVVDMLVVDKEDIEKYFSYGELEMFRKYGGYDATKVGKE